VKSEDGGDQSPPLDGSRPIMLAGELSLGGQRELVALSVPLAGHVVRGGNGELATADSQEEMTSRPTSREIPERSQILVNGWSRSRRYPSVLGGTYRQPNPTCGLRIRWSRRCGFISDAEEVRGSNPLAPTTNAQERGPAPRSIGVLASAAAPSSQASSRWPGLTGSRSSEAPVGIDLNGVPRPGSDRTSKDPPIASSGRPSP
jgi:hypothetical protein